MSRREQQLDLMYAIGTMLAPLKDLADQGAMHSQAYVRPVAQVQGDRGRLVSIVKQFASEPDGTFYLGQYNEVVAAVDRLCETFNAMINSGDMSKAARVINGVEGQIRKAILQIPVDDALGIHEANTPFRVFMFVRSLIESAAARIDWVDPYHDSTLFTRYLCRVPAGVTVTLVRHESKPNVRMVQEFVQASIVYSNEMGPSRYVMGLTRNIHDRWLRVDQLLYTLGTSSSTLGLGTPCTITAVPDTPENHSRLEEIIAGADLWFGPKAPVHRT